MIYVFVPVIFFLVEPKMFNGIMVGRNSLNFETSLAFVLKPTISRNQRSAL